MTEDKWYIDLDEMEQFDEDSDEDTDDEYEEDEYDSETM